MLFAVVNGRPRSFSAGYHHGSVDSVLSIGGAITLLAGYEVTWIIRSCNAPFLCSSLGSRAKGERQREEDGRDGGERVWWSQRSAFWLGLLVGRLEVLYRAACQHHAEDARDVT